MDTSEATRSASGLHPAVPTPKAGGLDRDLAFAEAERRLLGMELRPVTLDRFVVLHRLGQGAMGVVYAAHDPKLDRKVALKLVDTSGYGSEGIVEAQSRIEREARAAADLAHPNIVTIYDTGAVGDQVFLAMELVDGTTLRQWLQTERRWQEIVSMFIEIGRGLAAAHDKGIVHRDFKPDNVLVGRDERPRVVDFGLARPIPDALRHSQGLSATDPGSEPANRATSDGSSEAAATRSKDTSIAGTPAYMAPEQYEGRNIGPHSDQFGFCVALYEALLGERPFDGKNPGALAAAVTSGDRRPLPRGHGIPPSVLAAVLQGLQLRVRDRHRSMHHLMGALRRARDARRRRVLGLAGTATLAGAVLGTYAITSQSTPPPLDPCAGADAPIQDRWNDERRARLRQLQLDATPFAASSWSVVEPKLDRFAEDWGTMRREACEDGQHRGGDSALVLELRYACLDRALSRFDAFVEQLESPDFMGALLGPSAADGIDRLWRCEDRQELVEVLHANGLAGQTDSTRLADGLARWAAGYERLSQANMLHAMGKREPATEQVRTVIEQARADGLRTLEAEAQLSLGQWTRDPGALTEALALAVAAGPPDQAAEVALGLAELGGVPEGVELSVAREHVHYARSFLARMGERASVALRARVPAIEGQLALQDGDNRAALAHFESALALAQAELPADHTDVLVIRGNLAMTLKRLGETQRAADSYQALMTAQAEVLGPDHPDVGRTAFNLGVTALDTRQLDEAERNFLRAKEVWTVAFGAEDPQLSKPASALGEVHRVRGELSSARELQTRALRMREGAFGPEHPQLCVVLDELGEIELADDNAALARQHLERSLAIRRAHPSPGMATTLTRLGRALVADERTDEGIEALEEALVLRSKDGTDPVLRATTELGLARVLHGEDRDLPRARSLSERALERLRGAPQRRPDEREAAERWARKAFGQDVAPEDVTPAPG